MIWKRESFGTLRVVSGARSNFGLALLLFITCAPGFGQNSMQLSDVANPLSYALDLTIIPGATHFDGKATINIQLNQFASSLVLNAEEIVFTEVNVISHGKVMPAKVANEGYGRVHHFPQALGRRHNPPKYFLSRDIA